MFTFAICWFLILTAKVSIAQNSIEPTKTSTTVQLTVTVTGTPSPLVTPTPVIVTLPPTTKLACDLNPCLNGATCTNLVPRETKYKCDCANGWTGDNCAFTTNGFECKTGIQYIKVGNLTITSDSPINIVHLLLDNSTDFFKESCEAFKTNLNKSISASDPSISLLNLRCLSFSFSNYYYVTYIMDFPTSNKVTTQLLSKAIDNGITILNDSDQSCRLVFNSSFITDLDECRTSPGYCRSSAICTNYQGGFTCQCPSGYEMLYNGECQYIETNASNILVIVLPTVFGALLLFIVLICVFIAVRRQRFRYELGNNPNPP